MSEFGDMELNRPQEDNEHLYIINAETENTSQISLLEIPWEDVVFKYIMPCLPLQTQFQLRRVSRRCLEMVTLYFSLSKCVNTCRIANRMTAGALIILTKDNTSLHDLVLRNSKDWLTDKLLTSVFTTNHRLQKVDLANCSSVTNCCLQVLAVNCRNLKDMSLRECHWVSVEGITVLALNCGNLESLDLTGCWGLNDEAVILLAYRCKKLRYLSVAKIYGLTDDAMSILAREGSSIKHLNIQGCWRLSDDSMRILAEYGSSLQALQARECRDITETTLSKLRLRGVKIDVRPPPALRRLSDIRQRARLNLQI